MAGTATVQITATLTGGNTTQAQYGPATFTNTSANETISVIAVISGNVTVTVPTTPTQATGVVLIPPTNSTVTKTLKGIAADTGVPISPSAPTFIPFATSPPATFVITGNGSESVLARWV